MIRTQVQLTEKQADGLRKLARDRDESVSSLIRDAVDRLLDEPHSPSREEIKRRALEAMGMFSSPGPTDVAERHDEYFVEAIESRWRRS